MVLSLQSEANSFFVKKLHLGLNNEPLIRNASNFIKANEMGGKVKQQVILESQFLPFLVRTMENW